ncbi:MAG TPA: hypothetical protein VNR11_20645 [Xanthobacteraceae bacterium]|nr:hypothetical protein [Xanthobacteraceae bacterium]
MGEVIYISEARTPAGGDPWVIVASKIVPCGPQWGVAYRCANGKSWTRCIGTREQAQQDLKPVGSLASSGDFAGAQNVRDTQPTDRLIVVLQDLYASGIHTQIASASARGWIVRVGDRDNGCVAERIFATAELHKAADWLIKEAARAYPGSVFAQHYAGFAAS